MEEKGEINENNCMSRFSCIIIVFFKVSLCYNVFFEFFPASLQFCINLFSIKFLF